MSPEDIISAFKNKVNDTETDADKTSNPAQAVIQETPHLTPQEIEKKRQDDILNTIVRKHHELLEALNEANKKENEIASCISKKVDEKDPKNITAFDLLDLGSSLIKCVNGLTDPTLKQNAVNLISHCMENYNDVIIPLKIDLDKQFGMLKTISQERKKTQDDLNKLLLENAMPASSIFNQAGRSEEYNKIFKSEKLFNGVSDSQYDEYSTLSHSPSYVKFMARFNNFTTSLCNYSAKKEGSSDTEQTVNKNLELK